MRITKVYTRTGDLGETSLVNGARVSKADLRVAAYGDVDELNSVLGVVRTLLPAESEPAGGQMDGLLGKIQNDLFVVGADLASPLEVAVPRVEEPLIAELEAEIDALLEELEPLTEFILPSGTQAGAMMHLARTVARRAERAVVALAAHEAINPHALTYLNRLSDLLFVAARAVNRRAGVPEHLANFSARNRRAAGKKEN